jgi:predicted DNA binding CopG/RHH family protein
VGRTRRGRLLQSAFTDASAVDWRRGERVVFYNLKPSTATIPLRLPVGLLARIKAEANRRDVPYQSYLKMLLADALDQRWATCHTRVVVAKL